MRDKELKWPSKADQEADGNDNEQAPLTQNE